MPLNTLLAAGRHLFFCFVRLAVFFTPVSVAAEEAVTFSHAIALHGKPSLDATMAHYNYVNPDAPKGGTLRQAQIGNFDTFNPYTSQGRIPYGLLYTHDTLLNRNWDEPLTKYGVTTKTIERPKDNSWVAFHINPDARFHDNHPITAADVVFSFKALTEQGSLFWRQFYQDIEKVEATSSHRVLFTFKHPRNKELPLLLGQLPVMASHWWQGRDFAATTLDIPVGSGPYRIKRFEPGRFIEYERVSDYWARNHPVNVGRFNFATMRFDIYQDVNVILEAINSGQLDLRFESDPRYWGSGYRQSALDEGQLIKGSWTNQNPQTQSLILNSRKKWLSDIQIREAITVLLDIDWVLEKLLDNTVVRAYSLFAGTEMAAPPLITKAEEALLDSHRKQIPERVFNKTWPPANQLSKRERLKYALNLFNQAGLKLRNGVLETPSGKPVEFELLLGDHSLERLMQSQVRRFAEAGIKLRLRTVESARYLKHIRELDFDLIIHTFRHTPSPGSEQRSFWGSENRETPGTLNFAGVSDPVIDGLLERIPEAGSREELVTLLLALDRLLLWQFKAIPLSYAPNWQAVYSNRIVSPQKVPRFIVDRSTWWAAPSQHQEQKLQEQKLPQKTAQ